MELIDEWDVMGMRATVSHGVRVTGYDLPPERLIGEPGAWTRRDPRTFTLAFAANHIGAAGAAFEFATDWVRERPGMGESELIRVAIGTMASDLYAARSGLLVAADLWDEGRYDDAELASLKALHLGKQAALEIVNRAFDVCGPVPPSAATRWSASSATSGPSRSTTVTMSTWRRSAARRSRDRSGARAMREPRRSRPRGPDGRGAQLPPVASPRQRAARSAIRTAISAPRSARLATSIRSAREHESWQIGPSPSSVGTPSAAAKLRVRATP